MNTKELSNRLTQIVQGITNTQPIRGLRLLSRFSLKNLIQARTIFSLFQI